MLIYTELQIIMLYSDKSYIKFLHHWVKNDLFKQAAAPAKRRAYISLLADRLLKINIQITHH